MRFLAGSCAIAPILVSREKRVRLTSTIVSRSLVNTAALVSMGSRSVGRNIVGEHLAIPTIHSKIGRYHYFTCCDVIKMRLYRRGIYVRHNSKEYKKKNDGRLGTFAGGSLVWIQLDRCEPTFFKPPLV